MIRDEISMWIKIEDEKPPLNKLVLLNSGETYWVGYRQQLGYGNSINDAYLPVQRKSSDPLNQNYCYPNYWMPIVEAPENQEKISRYD